jgi:fermentation-respiration switch protein FrsA (DUF1100 family)
VARKKSRPPKTLLEHAYVNLRARDERTGWRASARAVKGAYDAVTVAANLAIARAVQGEWLDQAGYAEFWDVSERTAQRQWKLFKEAFPGQTSPRGVAEVFYSRFPVDRLRSGDTSGVASLRVDQLPFGLA